MKRISIFGILTLMAGIWAVAHDRILPPDSSYAAETAPTRGTSMLLVHNVYFSLNESTPANRQKLVEACKKYLSDHSGTVFFAAGTVADLDRPVNDRDFDVGLHVIFKDRASHDAYQVAPTHLKFIEENKATWKKVRVFDSDASGAGK